MSVGPSKGGGGFDNLKNLSALERKKTDENSLSVNARALTELVSQNKTLTQPMKDDLNSTVERLQKLIGEFNFNNLSV